MGQALDLTRQRFGKLVVKHQEGKRNGKTQWFCECDCGKTTLAITSALRLGRKKSCGCMSKKIDLTGRRFGILTVIEEVKDSKRIRVLWKCLCDCGQLTQSSTANLIRGLSQSCGCVRTKHNGKGTRLYRIWAGMKDRCLNIKSKYRSRYGGRGITICKEWADAFAVFRDWALSNGYKDNLTIDRIENNGNYEPSNCQWLTRKENTSKGNR